MSTRQIPKENIHFDGSKLTIEITVEQIRKEFEVTFPASPMEIEISKVEKHIQISIPYDDGSSIDAALK